MKKRLLTLMLAVFLAATSLAIPVSAASASSSALRLVQALGIMSGDGNGNLMLDSNVTRAQFVTMMTRASTYKDSIGSDGTGYSLFKDVKSSHWASEYISLAVQEGWVSGYIDGTFRPDSTITLEEACSALLRLLGYDASSLAGSFPSAQLNKANSLGLRDQISLKRGSLMTRRDCVQLFYNLMTAQTSAGQIYATTLGYTVTNGEVDYNDVALNNLSGPYVAASGDKLPFAPTTLYRNGTLSTSATLNQYDVYYYNASLGTAWIYTERVSGKITALSPSSTSPTSVTVAGAAYEIGSSSVSYQLSALGGGSVGSIVTLLLGMDNAVVGILTGDEVDMMYYGVVQSCSKGIASNGSAVVETTLTIVCTDGSARTFTTDKDASYTVGKLVSVNSTGDGIVVKGLPETHMSGRINNDATMFGKYNFADNVKILDTSDEGDAASVEKKRLAGCDISSSNVRYYTLNEKNEIEHLILKNATGDTWKYAYMTSVEDLSVQMSITVNYVYLIDGTKTTTCSENKKYPVETGGIEISYENDGSIKFMRQMSSVRLTSLSVQTAMADNRKYTLADDVQVYLRKGGEYYLTTISAINAEDYTLTGWYDTASGAAGGRIRIIIATGK